MLKLFSNYPSGSSGAAIFLLRGANGAAAFVYGIIHSSEKSNSTVLDLFIGLFSIISAVGIITGFLTPLFAALIFFGGTGVLILRFSSHFSLPDNIFSAVLVCVMALAIVLLGAGAFSLDARLFGRREIFIPDDSLPPEN